MKSAQEIELAIKAAALASSEVQQKLSALELYLGVLGKSPDHQTIASEAAAAAARLLGYLDAAAALLPGEDGEEEN